MKLGPTVPLAATLLLSGIAGAFAQAPQQGAPPCFNEFMPLRTEAEKRADAIQAAGKRKAPIEEVCGLFKRFYEAEDKVVKYAVTNATFSVSLFAISLLVFQTPHRCGDTRARRPERAQKYVSAEALELRFLLSNRGRAPSAGSA